MTRAGTWLDRLDLRLHNQVLDLRQTWLDDVFRTITHLGGVQANAILLGAAIVFGFRTRRIVFPTFAYVALTVGQLARTALSYSIDRARPPRGDWLVFAPGRAMPSGHSATSVMAYGLLVMLVWSLLTTSVQRRAAVIGVAVIAVLVGASRVYLGVHWPSDVIAGWAFGAAWVGLCVVGWRALGPRLSHPT